MGFPGSYDKTDNGRQLTSKLWRDVNPAAIAADPGRGWLHHEDFLELPLDTSIYTAATVTLTQGGSAGTMALDATEDNGVLIIDSGDTDAGDGVNLQWTAMPITPAAGKTIVCEWRMKSATIANADLFWGLSLADTTVVTSVPAISPSDWIGFHVLDDGAGVSFSMDDGTQSDHTGDVHTLVAATYFKSGFKINGTESIEVYVNGEAIDVSDVLITSLPDTLVVPTIVCQSGGAGTQPVLDVDWMRVAVLNP